MSPRWWLNATLLHWRETQAGVGVTLPPQSLDRARLDASYQQWQSQRAETTEGDLRGPHLSIVALIEEPAHLVDVTESVIAQSFQHWDLSFVPLRWGGEYAGTLGRWAGDTRIQVVNIQEILRADGTWLPPGQGHWVVFLDSQSRLAAGALARVARATELEPTAWIYTDDDLCDRAGRRSDPNLKGAFSPELALVDDYATRLAVVPRRAVVDTGGLEHDYGVAQIYDLLLRAIDRGLAIEHLPAVCCHRRDPVPSALTERHRRAAERGLARVHPGGQIVAEPNLPSGVSTQRVRWCDTGRSQVEVTVVIPTRDRVDLLRTCVASLRRTIDMARIRLLIVDDRSREAGTRAYLAELEAETGCRILRPVATGVSFNYAKLMNLAAREVDTPLMLHLNNDVEAIGEGWLQQMQGWLTLPDVAVVGPKLLYDDGSIQHAGVMVSSLVGAPGHLFHRLRNDDAGYQWLPHRLRNVSAVTGACLLTRTALFLEVGGFDDEHLAVQFNDIDYCLRVIGLGKRIVYEPAAVLSHRTSASRGNQIDHRENVYFREKYRDFDDPFINPWLDPLSLLGATPALKARSHSRRGHRGGAPGRAPSHGESHLTGKRSN
jgi:GT2 family glycosyltransferase